MIMIIRKPVKIALVVILVIFNEEWKTRFCNVDVVKLAKKVISSLQCLWIVENTLDARW